jgi:AraC-like DNA-binding protein
VGSIRIGEYPLESGFWFPAHVHPKPQILWASRGVLGVGVADDQWVLPPTRALWVPTGVVHRTGATRQSLLHGIYLSTDARGPGWPRPTVLAVGALFAELIHYLGRDDLESHKRARAEAVLVDQLEPLPAAPLEIRMPADPRAALVARTLRADPADQRGLDALARMAGTSPRTLSRLFVAETGRSLDRWRTNLRMWLALPLLADGEPVSAVAHAVGYATASAFLAAFRRTVGTTPRAYLASTQVPTPRL